MGYAITIDAVDQSTFVRLESLIAVEAAYGCEVGQGGLDRDDTVLGTVPAMKAVLIDEPAASPTRMFTGYVGPRTVDRGPLGSVDTRRQFDTTLVDLNTLWDDPVLEGSDANRASETDYARMTWLIGTTEFAALSIAAGVVPNTNTVTLDARDYRGEHPRLVAEECMEAAAKNAFLYDYGSGRKVYYDLATGTSLSSVASLTTVASDLAANIYGMAIPKLVKDPARIYSTVRFEYSGGHVTITRAATATAYRARAITIRDSTVKTAAGATVKANKYLDRADDEQRIFSTSVYLDEANVNDIRAGMRIQVKCPHLDIAAFTWMRISRRNVSVANDTTYLVALEFAEDLQPMGFGGRTGDGGGATVIDGTTPSLTRYELFKEDGSQFFGSAGSGYIQVPVSFTFGTIAGPDPTYIQLGVYYNIGWPYTDCGVGTGGVAGRAWQEAWYRFAVDLADTSVIGVRFTVGALTGVTGLAATNQVALGVKTGADPTDRNQWTTVGSISTAGGTVFIPRSLLIDDGAGYCWFVLAPGWTIDYGLFACAATYGGQFDGYAVVDATSSAGVVTAKVLNLSGSGLTPWVPGIGAIDGSNKTFSLPGWDGTGIPEVRLGVLILGGGEYTYDTTALTVTLETAPPASMAGQVAFRYNHE